MAESQSIVRVFPFSFSSSRASCDAFRTHRFGLPDWTAAESLACFRRWSTVALCLFLVPVGLHAAEFNRSSSEEGRAPLIREVSPGSEVVENSMSSILAPPDPMAHFYVFGLGLGLGVGGAVSWKFSQTWTGKFSNLDEGWFGSDSYAGGSDKVGHFCMDYVLVRSLDEIYLAHDYDREISIRNAFIGSMVIRTVMEVADGFTDFKFSRQDLIANMLGSISSAALLKYPAWDRTLSISWTYAPSQEKLDGKVDWVSIDNDYNGSIYHFDLKFKGFFDLIGISEPQYLDNYILGLSYFTRGYDRKRETGSRYVGLTFGPNIEELIASRAAPDSFLQRYKPFFNYIKLPYSFVGLHYDLDEKRFGARYGLNYFY